MDDRIQLSPGLELVVINSLKFNKADGPLRDLVRQAYQEVQLPVFRERGENPDDKALAPVDSIGSTREPGALTDKKEPSGPGYHHIYLLEYGRPIGMRVTDEFRVPHFGDVIMEYFSALVPHTYANDMHTVDGKLLSDSLKGKQHLAPQEILLAFNKQLTKEPDKFAVSISDGVGIDTFVLGHSGYEHFGPKRATMLWVPPMDATKKEDYLEAIPAELYVRFGDDVTDHRIPEKAALFIAIKKYIREGTTETNPRRLKKAGYTFNTLPAVVKTREAITSVAAANGGYVPCSPIIHPLLAN